MATAGQSRARSWREVKMTDLVSHTWKTLKFETVQELPTVRQNDCRVPGPFEADRTLSLSFGSGVGDHYRCPWYICEQLYDVLDILTVFHSSG